MIKRPMSINGEPVPLLSFVPRLGADFESFEVEIPELPSYTDEIRFRHSVRDELQLSCGNMNCIGDITLATAERIGVETGRIVIGGSIYCLSETCPLEGPEGAGDQEPREPLPKAPGSQVAAELPLLVPQSR